MNRMYLCHDHAEQIKKIANDTHSVDYGVCEICGKVANCFIQWVEEIELPDERIAKLF